MRTRAFLLVLFSFLTLSACMKGEDDVDDTVQVEQSASEGEEQNESSGEATGSAGASSDDIEQWTVAQNSVLCEGEERRRCYRVKREGEDEWSRNISEIEGFEQEPDMRYVVRVRVVPVETPGADQPVERYELVEILDQSSVLGGPEATTQEGGEQTGDSTEATGQADDEESTLGEPCEDSSDCSEGEMCTGPQGCDVQWTCQPSRPCTKDLQTYCSCEGETVRGSGSCPPVPYLHRGFCEGDEPTAP
jgi:hypothetical protein